jgi:hypothetical protein
VAGEVAEAEESTVVEVVKHNSIDQVVDAANNASESAPAPTAASDQTPKKGITVVASAN